MVFDLAALRQCLAHQKMRALQEFARRASIELLELANEMRLVEIGGRRRFLPVAGFLPGQAVGRVQRAKLAVQLFRRTSEVVFGQPFDLAW